MDGADQGASPAASRNVRARDRGVRALTPLPPPSPPPSPTHSAHPSTNPRTLPATLCHTPAGVRACGRARPRRLTPSPCAACASSPLTAAPCPRSTRARSSERWRNRARGRCSSSATACPCNSGPCWCACSHRSSSRTSGRLWRSTGCSRSNHGVTTCQLTIIRSAPTVSARVACQRARVGPGWRGQRTREFFGSNRR